MPTKTRRNNTRTRKSPRAHNKKRNSSRTSTRRRPTAKKSSSRKNTPNFGSTFKSAVKRGTPASTAVQNIAAKHRKTESFVWNWLFRNGFVNRKKVNGSFIYWPTFEFSGRMSVKNIKPFAWQQFINWAINAGYCTPQQVNHIKSQKDFFDFFAPFFAQQFGWTILCGWNATRVKNFARGTASSNGADRTKKRATAKKRRSSTKKRSSTTTSRKRKATTTKATKRASAKSKVRRNAKKRAVANRSFKFPSTASSSTRRAYRRAA